MRRVHVEEAAAVCAELLDGHLHGGGTHGQRLLGHGRRLGLGLSLLVEDGVALGILHGGGGSRRLEERHRLIGAEVLHDALRDEQERQNEGHWQQDVERRAHEVDPEVADRLRVLGAEPPDERNERGDASRGRDEVLDGERQHLCEITHSHLAAEAADLLAKEGLDLEVVDLRTLIPLDKEMIFDSVRKTSKAIVLYEDNKTGGVGAEVSALLAEECFDALDGPVVRIAAPDTPVPFSTPLEEFFLPKVGDIVTAARTLAAR